MKLDETLESCIARFFAFHRRDAPGGVIGCHMVEHALDLLGSIEGQLNAAVETRVCLPDCIQVMTGCTVGNGHLWLQDHIGKFALSFWDRGSLQGVRVYLDVDRLSAEQHPDLVAFHLRQRDPRVLTDMKYRAEVGKKVVEQFMTLKTAAFSHCSILVKLPPKPPMPPSRRCIGCGEPFLTDAPPNVARCAPCADGDTYYEELRS